MNRKGGFASFVGLLAGPLCAGALVIETDEQPNARTRELRVVTRGWAGLDTPDRARVAVKLLEDAWWVRRQPVMTAPTGGRPSEEYAVNPAVATAQL